LLLLRTAEGIGPVFALLYAMAPGERPGSAREAIARTPIARSRRSPRRVTSRAEATHTSFAAASAIY